MIARTYVSFGKHKIGKKFYLGVTERTIVISLQKSLFYRPAVGEKALNCSQLIFGRDVIYVGFNNCRKVASTLYTSSRKLSFC